MRALLKLVLVITLSPSPLIRGAQAAPDLFLGRWVLDPQASHYPAGTCPKRMTIEMTRDARGIHYHSETEPAAGAALAVDYTADYDGRPAMVIGNRGILLPVSLKRDSPGRVVATYTSAAQVVATSTRTISEDGSLMTITTQSRDALGQSQTSTGVYRRAEDAK